MLIPKIFLDYMVECKEFPESHSGKGDSREIVEGSRDSFDQKI